MTQYRISIVVEESVNGDPYEDNHSFLYVSASSENYRCILDLYQALKAVAFYWRLT